MHYTELFKITTVCFRRRYTVEKVSYLYYVSDSFTHLSVGVWCIEPQTDSIFHKKIYIYSLLK